MMESKEQRGLARRRPGGRAHVSFCEHCQGQRFDRAQVLRTLRQLRGELRATQQDSRVDAALRTALEAVRELEIPHLEPEDPPESVVVH
jgi:hypothetical protein